MSAPAPTASSPRRGGFSAVARWSGRGTLALGLGLTAYILLVSNAIVFRHPVRFDLTEESLYSLSRPTLDKLKLVREPVEIVIPTLLLKDNPEHVAQSQALFRARRLLDEIVAVQPLLKIVAEVDVLQRPDRWDALRNEYKLEGSQVNRILFFAGASRERRQAVTPQDLALFEEAKDPADPPKVRRFRGEKAISDAVGRLISEERKKAYFVQDHGEAQLQPQNDRVAGLGGLRAARHELDTEGFEAVPLSLGSVRDVPSDCALLVIAGASRPFAREEITRLDDYLRRGGKLLVALNRARTGLEDLLADWGMVARDGAIHGRRDTFVDKTLTAEVVARGFSSSHPATRPFANVPRFEVFLINPRALEATGKGKGLEATSILSAVSSEGMLYYFAADRSAAPPVSGSFDVALAAEQQVPERPPPGFQRLEARVLVVGSFAFLSDQYFLRGTNRDFFVNSVHWLAGSEERTTEGGSDWAERTLRMDPSIENYLFWVPIFLLPGVFLAAGAIVYFARRA